MKISWNTNSSGNGIWAAISLNANSDIMLSVYRCIVTGRYIHMVWIEGHNSRHSKAEHHCCISAMVHAEASATELFDEIISKSAIWQEV